MWVQEKIAAAEERLWNARLEAALDQHEAKVAAGVSQMREGGASDLEIAVYEAEQAVDEAKIESSAEVQVASHHPRQFLSAGIRLENKFVLIYFKYAVK